MCLSACTERTLSFGKNTPLNSDHMFSASVINVEHVLLGMKSRAGGRKFEKRDDMHILVSAFSCSHGFGSEASVAYPKIN